MMQEYEALAGDHIRYACTKLAAMAPAFMMFNDIRVEAQPGDTVAVLEARYDAAMAAVRAKREADEKAFSATPEGQARNAEMRANAEEEKKRQRARLAGIKLTGVRERFPWDGLGQLSGFGGGYEEACRTMVYAGFVELLAQGADPKTLRLIRANSVSAAVAPLDAALIAVEPGCSGAMHGGAMAVCLYVAEHGWEKFVAVKSRAHEP